MNITAEQKEHLVNAFKAAVNLSTADITDNASRCGCFHIQPFNTKLDKETVKDIIESVRIYVNSWIVYPLSEVVGISPDDVTAENLIYWHRLEANRLEYQLKEKRSKKQ